MNANPWQYPLVLLGLGLGWGITQPLGKIAASTGHKPFGLIFWQLAVCSVVLGGLCLLRGKRPKLSPQALRFYVVVAILGTLVPNATFYISVTHLPAGIMSILISMVPLLAFPIALILGTDHFSARRLGGLALGLAGVLLIALPNASLPDPAMAAFLPLAMVGPLFYAIEGTYVARFGTAGMDALTVMLAFGHWFAMPLPPTRIEWALIGSSALHALLYATYVWLAAKAGAVFASQSSYIVTASGVIWAMLLLGERFSPWVWAAAVVMLAGLALVQPKFKEPPVGV
jgi:drug/metabolite transporter (DMT)-like permease